MRRLIPQVRLRGGIPRFAGRLFAGEPTTIVALGTSVTIGGHYLAHLTDALQAASGNARVGLVVRGFRGYGSLHGAFRVTSDVLPAAPDLVVLEFAHNEEGPAAVELAPQTIHGIVAQVRAVRPACEFIFVYLARPGQAAGGVPAATQAWERVADELAISSIDLGTPLEALVAAGGASWFDGPDALTQDGVHFSDAADEIIGRPFAHAVGELVQASRDLVPVERAAQPTPFDSTARAPAAAFVLGEGWAVGVPHVHDVRSADAYDEHVAHAHADGARMRIVAQGLHIFAWTMGLGRIEILRDGTVHSVHEIDWVGWNTITLATAMPQGWHTLDITVYGGAVVVGDVMVAGVPRV